MPPASSATPAASTKKPRTSTARRTTSSSLPKDERAALDAAIGDLEQGSRVWVALTLDQRARLLGRVRDAVGAVAQEWVDVATMSKGLEPGHPLSGEEWLGGPWSIVGILDALRETLEAIAAGKSPLDGVKLDRAPGGRLRAHTFPVNGTEKSLLSGFTGEVWFEPGVTAAEARRAAGLGQLHPTEAGGVGLVLGAGNVTSIPVGDVLYELFAHNRVALLKVNPTQDALVPVFERALAALIEPGFVRIVRGGPETGAYLTAHPGFSHVHITGSATTFDAIVWGTGTDAAARRAADDPKLTVPITAELGGVSPIIVVPGRWSAADLKYQAAHVATMRLVNAGHNCIAGQVVILSSDWPQREEFLRELHAAYAAAPERPVWYPRGDERLKDAASAYPDAVWSADHTRAIVQVGDGDQPAEVETTEYFAPILGIAEVAGTGQEFLDAAVAHANERLTGTLGANILIDPATEEALGDGFERAIADLRFGAIAINTWTAFIFTTARLTWGGIPGATLADVSSGIGVVHNALLLDRVERSVARGPFRPFPRSVGDGVRRLRRAKATILPTPPWFVNSRTGAEVSGGMTRYLIDGKLPGLLKALTKALQA
ncbi:aldehyde dehydrogenase family protein [Microbacterium ureisolvens]|uniref:aldehyde dehydrogenase family protein n=1 Tax=Microbacterium ureisolvens TaxID=2781186 RepID=UPI00362D6521